MTTIIQKYKFAAALAACCAVMAGLPLAVMQQQNALGAKGLTKTHKIEAKGPAKNLQKSSLSVVKTTATAPRSAQKPGLNSVKTTATAPRRARTTLGDYSDGLYKITCRCCGERGHTNSRIGHLYHAPNVAQVASEEPLSNADPVTTENCGKIHKLITGLENHPQFDISECQPTSAISSDKVRCDPNLKGIIDETKSAMQQGKEIRLCVAYKLREKCLCHMPSMVHRQNTTRVAPETDASASLVGIPIQGLTCDVQLTQFPLTFEISVLKRSNAIPEPYTLLKLLDVDHNNDLLSLLQDLEKFVDCGTKSDLLDSIIDKKEEAEMTIAAAKTAIETRLVKDQYPQTSERLNTVDNTLKTTLMNRTLHQIIQGSQMLQDKDKTYCQKLTDSLETQIKADILVLLYNCLD